MIDVAKYNSEAWDREVESGNVWTKPVSPERCSDSKRIKKRKNDRRN
jgi:hypothetical protein